MARIRSIKPELLDDEKTAALPHDTWRMFVSSLLLADDYGNFRASTLLVHGAVFWSHPDADVPRMLRELGDAGLLTFYSVRGQRYAHVNGWAKHQKVDHPSAPLCPGPDQADGTPNDATVGQRSTDSRDPREPVGNDSRLTGIRTRTRTRTTNEREDPLVSGVAASPPSPASPPLLIFPTVRGRKSGPTEWHYTQSFEDELREYFPALDVRSAVRAALGWVKAKEANRKTADGMRRFVTGWLNRAQNRREHLLPAGSRSQGQNGTSKESNGLALYCDWHKAILNTGKPSKLPAPTCPECKHLSARERDRASSGPVAIGALDDPMSGWGR